MEVGRDRWARREGARTNIGMRLHYTVRMLVVRATDIISLPRRAQRSRPTFQIDHEAVEAAVGAALRTESAIVVGKTSVSPRSLLKRIETVFDTPRSCIVTP